MSKYKLFTADLKIYLRNNFFYDEYTGFLYRVHKTVKPTKIGFDNGKNYLKCNIQRKHYFVHRICWFFKYGTQPDMLDHINGVRDDNRLCNLREATHGQNQQNSKKCKNKRTSIYKGVYFTKESRSWRALISSNNKRIHLGYFKNEVDAAKAYDEKAKELFGEFAKTNFH